MMALQQLHNLRMESFLHHHHLYADYLILNKKVKLSETFGSESEYWTMNYAAILLYHP